MDVSLDSVAFVADHETISQVSENPPTAFADANSFSRLTLLD